MRTGAFLSLFLISSMLCSSPDPVRHFYPKGNYIRSLKAGDKPRVEEITLYSKESADSDNKLMRKGTLVAYPNAKATIVISHGFMCEEKDAGIIRQMFPKGHYNFVTFDMRAHGQAKEGQVCSFEGSDTRQSGDADIPTVRTRLGPGDRGQYLPTHNSRIERC